MEVSVKGVAAGCDTVEKKADHVYHSDQTDGFPEKRIDILRENGMILSVRMHTGGRIIWTMQRNH